MMSEEPENLGKSAPIRHFCSKVSIHIQPVIGYGETKQLFTLNPEDAT